MKLNRLLRNSRWASGCASLFMLGFFVGRLSILHGWLERFCVICWLVNVAIWTVPIYLEHRRDERQFREAMKQLEDEMRRKMYE
jgi:hypothetical protein